MNIQFREPTSKEELASLFHLRHNVYSEDEHLHSMVTESSVQLDLNSYDHMALHFAAYIENEAIAYIRITTEGETHFTPWVKEIANPDSNWSANFVRELNGRKIGEVGKLAIHKDHRTGGVVLSEFIAAFVDYCKKEHTFRTGFGTCSLPLERFYRKFGFVRAEGCEPFTYQDLPEAVIVRFDN
jgi:predicted GNAT family N-acyltransferase